MTPYLSILFAPFVELLQQPDDPAHPFGPEQLSVVQALSKSMSVDEGGMSNHSFMTPMLTYKQIKTVFWRDDRLEEVLPALVPLVAHPGGSGATGDEALSAALVALCDAV